MFFSCSSVTLTTTGREGWGNVGHVRKLRLMEEHTKEVHLERHLFHLSFETRPLDHTLLLQQDLTINCLSYFHICHLLLFFRIHGYMGVDTP